MTALYYLCLIKQTMAFFLNIHGRERTIIQEQVIFISMQIYVQIVTVMKMQLGLRVLARVPLATSLGASIPTP